MKHDIAIIGFALCVLMLVAGGIWWEWALWSECRATNSWFYCVRVLSK